jgi:hypothetical protein
MVRESCNEMAIEVSEAQERLHFLLCHGGWLLCHSCYLDWVHMNLTFGNDQAEVLNGGFFKFALVMPKEKFVLAKSLEHDLRNSSVLFDRFHEYEDIVEVDTNYAFHNEILKDGIHHGLKGRGGVCESEKHHQRLEEALVRTKCCLPLIALLHAHIGIPPLYIEFCEVLRTSELVDELRNQGERVLVLDHHCVQGPIILYETQCTILLLDEENW